MSSETLPVVFQAAKMAKYTNYQRTCDILFAVFTLTWIVSRIGVFPSHILYSTTIEAPQVCHDFTCHFLSTTHDPVEKIEEL